MSVGRLPTASHPPGGPQSLLAGGRASEAFRRPPTGQEGHLPPREVSLPPGGQNPITLEYQIYPPTIDTLVTGMVDTTDVIIIMIAEVVATSTILVKVGDCPCGNHMTGLEDSRAAEELSRVLSQVNSFSLTR